MATKKAVKKAAKKVVRKKVEPVKDFASLSKKERMAARKGFAK